MKAFKAWAWYCIQLLFWIGIMSFCIYGFILLMSSNTHNKEQMQGDAGGAVMALIFFFFSLLAIWETILKYPKKHSSRY